MKWNVYRNNCEILLVKFCISRLLYYIPQGRGLVQLNFVSLVKNDVKVNTKGGSKCNSKQSLRLVTKLIYI